MSSRKTVPVNAPQRHVEQSLPVEWIAVDVAGETVVINEAGEGSITAYTLAGETENPRVIAQSDAVMWDGMVGLTNYDDGLVNISHTFAGTRKRLVVTELLDEPVPVLERTELVSVEGTADSPQSRSDSDE